MASLDTSKVTVQDIVPGVSAETLVIKENIRQDLLDTLITEGSVVKDITSSKKLELYPKVQKRLSIANEIELLGPIKYRKRLKLKKRFETIKSLAEAKTDDEKDLAMRQLYYNGSKFSRKVFWKMGLKNIDPKKIEDKIDIYIKKLEEESNNSNSQKDKLILGDTINYSKLIYNNYIKTLKSQSMPVDEDEILLAG